MNFLAGLFLGIIIGFVIATGMMAYIEENKK